MLDSDSGSDSEGENELEYMSVVVTRVGDDRELNQGGGEGLIGFGGVARGVTSRESIEFSASSSNIMMSMICEID